MRSSISGLKCLMRPCRGNTAYQHAAHNTQTQLHNAMLPVQVARQKGRAFHDRHLLRREHGMPLNMLLAGSLSRLVKTPGQAMRQHRRAHRWCGLRSAW